MTFAEFKLDRLAIALITVIIVADLLPHPSLSSGMIERATSKVQQVLVETPN